MTVVRWLATAYVIGCGGFLMIASLGGIGVVHSDAQIAILVVGALLLMAGLILRPRRRGDG